MQFIKERKEVALSNSLVASKYHLTKEEQNLVLLVASQISKEDKDFKSYKVSISDIENATGNKHNRQRIKDMSLSIMSKPIVLPNSNAVVNWFSCIEPIDNETALKIRFDKKLKPYLLQLEQFTKAELGYVFSFKSKYSSRLYLLLKSYYGEKGGKYHKSVSIELVIDDLVKQFVMPKSYQTVYKNFKERFLMVSINEISEKTEFSICYKELKTGRKITSIEFCISAKEKTQEQLKKEIETTKTLSDYIPKNLSSKATSILLDEELGLKNHDLKHMFGHYKTTDIEDVCLDLWRCWDSPKIINKQGLFRGKIKQLNKNKTEDFSFFDEI